MKNHIDPLLALAKYQNTSTTPNGDDPGSNVIPEVSKTAEQFFLEHSKRTLHFLLMQISQRILRILIRQELMLFHRWL